MRSSTVSRRAAMLEPMESRVLLSVAPSLATVIAPTAPSGIHQTLVAQPAASGTLSGTILVLNVTRAGDAVTATASVLDVFSGSGISSNVDTTATGNVQFLDTTNFTTVATAPVVNGVATATFSAAGLPAGTTAVEAIYQGTNAGGNLPEGGSGGVSIAGGTYDPRSATNAGAGVFTPTILSSTLPSSSIYGVKAKPVTVTVAVANTGVAAVKGTAKIEIFATKTGLLDGTQVGLTSILKRVVLGQGKSFRVKLGIKTLPASLTQGTYTLLARVTDPSGAQTVSTASSAFTVVPAVVSLPVTFRSVVVPVTVTAGTAFKRSSVTIVVTNTGNVAAVGPLTLTVYASSDGTVANGTVLTTLTKRVNIKPGKSGVYKLGLKTVPALNAGGYAVIATAIAPDAAITAANSGTTLVVTG